jgi:hypothetical protein
MTYTERQDRLHCAGKLISAEHMNLQGARPITTRYTIKNLFSPGVRFIVARSNDWWQIDLPTLNGLTRTAPQKSRAHGDGTASASSDAVPVGSFVHDEISRRHGTDIRKRFTKQLTERRDLFSSKWNSY